MQWHRQMAISAAAAEPVERRTVCGAMEAALQHYNAKTNLSWQTAPQREAAKRGEDDPLLTAMRNDGLIALEGEAPQ